MIFRQNLAYHANSGYLPYSVSCVSGVDRVLHRKLLALAAFAALALGGGSQALAAQLIVNGSFEDTTIPGSFGVGDGAPPLDGGPYYHHNQATGWTISGYNFIFTPGTLDTTGSSNGFQPVTVWGSNNGGSVVLPLTSPSGGNILLADGSIDNGIQLAGPISQTVSGLTAGQDYVVSFYWAAAQQFGPNYNGDTTDNWTVYFGSDTSNYLNNPFQQTATAAVPSHSFQPWTQESFTFTASSSTQMLTFLAKGTPDGQPPFALLDGVSLLAFNSVPEPSSWMMMVVGFGWIGGFMRARRRPLAGRRVLGMQIV